MDRSGEAARSQHRPFPAKDRGKTDAAIQNEVVNVTGGAIDANTVYQVFLPSGSYATYGSWNSCGGAYWQACRQAPQLWHRLAR